MPTWLIVVIAALVGVLVNAGLFWLAGWRVNNPRYDAPRACVACSGTGYRRNAICVACSGTGVRS